MVNECVWRTHLFFESNVCSGEKISQPKWLTGIVFLQKCWLNCVCAGVVGGWGDRPDHHVPSSGRCRRGALCDDYGDRWHHLLRLWSIFDEPGDGQACPGPHGPEGRHSSAGRPSPTTRHLRGPAGAKRPLAKSGQCFILFETKSEINHSRIAIQSIQIIFSLLMQLTLMEPFNFFSLCFLSLSTKLGFILKYPMRKIISLIFYSNIYLWMIEISVIIN